MKKKQQFRRKRAIRLAWLDGLDYARTTITIQKYIEKWGISKSQAYEDRKIYPNVLI